MPTAPSRRLFLAAGSSGAVFGALNAAVADEDAGSIGRRLLMRLERAHVEGFAFDPQAPDYDEVADNENYELHWSLREQIEALPVRSVNDLKIKVRAAQLALSRDPDAECDALGSFVSLSKTIMRDIMALTA